MWTYISAFYLSFVYYTNFSAQVNVLGSVHDKRNPNDID